MEIHKPKPWRGLREFLKEYAIIVLGVATALAGEQAVEWLHWRHEVAETRDALRAELARAVGSYQYRLASEGCAQKRLDELTGWLDSSRAGDKPPFTRPIGSPSGYSILTGAWDVAKAGQAAWRMPIAERLRFAHIYGSLDAFSEVMSRDSDAWRGLAEFTGAEPLDHQDRARMRGFIALARRGGATIRGYASFIPPDAASLGIKPEKRPAIDPAGEASFCQPLLAS